MAKNLRSRIFLLTLGLALYCPMAGADPVQDFRQTASDNLSKLERLHNEADNLVLQNRFREAIQKYTEIILIEPDDEDCYVDMGYSYMILGDLDRAKASLQNALHINPNCEPAILGLQKIMDPDASALPDVSPDSAPPLTATETAAPSASKPALPGPSLKPDDPDSVRAIQTALKKTGLYKNPVDGNFGPATRNAVLTFQKFHGLKMDGKVGPKTWDFLKPYLDSD